MSYRLIALDVDGTLIAEDLQVPDRTAAAIRQALDEGIYVTLATGRMFPSARRFAHLLDIQAPLICCQGALIAEPTGGNRLFHRGVPAALAIEVVRQMRSAGYHMNIYIDDTLYVDRVTPEAEFYAGMSLVTPNPVGDVIPLIEEAAARGVEPTKLVVVAAETHTPLICSNLQTCYAGRLGVVRSYRLFTEITHPTVTKGAALAWLAEHLGVPRDEVLAIGDNDNDIEMLQWAGMGVAMGQAAPHVRAAARHVTGHIHEAGAAAAIEEFALRANSRKSKV